MKIHGFALGFTLVCSATTLAEDCRDYPYAARDWDAEPVEGFDFPKILSTAAAVPFSEDIEDVYDAMTEAELAAKVRIAKFLNELVASSEEREKLEQRLTEQTGNNKQKSKTTVENIRKVMTSSSQQMQKGVVVLGDCYTEGREVRVTVGLKPETIAQAEALSGAMSGEQGAASGGDNLQRVEGHSNTKRLDDF